MYSDKTSKSCKQRNRFERPEPEVTGQTGSLLFSVMLKCRVTVVGRVTIGSLFSLSLCLLPLFPFRIPLKKFRSVRRELTDSGRKIEELLADRRISKYNYGFPSSAAPTPETLKNYLDVSTTELQSQAFPVDSTCARLEQPSKARVTCPDGPCFHSPSDRRIRRSGTWPLTQCCLWSSWSSSADTTVAYSGSIGVIRQ